MSFNSQNIVHPVPDIASAHWPQSINEQAGAIFNLLPNPVWVLDHNNCLQAANHSFEEMSESLFGSRLPIGGHFFDHYSKMSRYAQVFFADFISRARQGEQLPQTLEWANQNKIGWHEFNSVRLKQPNGQVWIAIIATDVSHNFSETNTLQPSDPRWGLVIRGNDDGLIDWDLNLGKAWFSPRLPTLLGYDPDDFDNNIQNFESRIHPDDKEHYQRNLQNYLTRTDNQLYRLHIECRLKHRFGHYVHFDLRAAAWWDNNGKATRLVCSLRDITERITLVEMMARNKEGLRAIVENTTDCIWSIDRDYNILVFNSVAFKEAIKLYGFELRHGRNFLLFLSGEDRIFWRQTYERGFNGEHFTIIKDVEHNGRQFFYELSVNPIVNRDLTVSGVSAIMRDVTERRKAEQELEELTLQLQKHVHELQKYAYITSHNLRAPVVNMVSLLDFFDHSNVGSETNKLLMPNLVESVEKLHTTINDLIGITEIHNRTNEVSGETDFEKIFQTTVLSLNEAIAESGAEISSDFGRAPTVSFPVAYLKNIFLCLIGNAIKYARPNIKPEIHISSGYLGSYTLLSVSDNGLGIDTNKYHGRLFGLYQRLHDHVAGKGLGLYTVRAQVEAMGGYVDLDSTPGKGSTFKIYIKTKS